MVRYKQCKNLQNGMNNSNHLNNLQFYIKVNIKNKPKIFNFSNILLLFLNYYKYHTNLIENVVCNETLTLLLENIFIANRNEKLDFSIF